jgi:hypothetical protein
MLFPREWFHVDRNSGAQTGPARHETNGEADLHQSEIEEVLPASRFLPFPLPVTDLASPKCSCSASGFFDFSGLEANAGILVADHVRRQGGHENVRPDRVVWRGLPPF